MATKLPAEIREAIKQNPNEVMLEDEQTNAIYFVVDEQTHRRAMRALQQQEDNDAIAAGLQQMEAGEGQTVAEVDAELRKEFGFPPRS